jgi:hypothetical protein
VADLLFLFQLALLYLGSVTPREDGIRVPLGPGGADIWRVRTFPGRENGKVRWVSRTVHDATRAARSALAKLVGQVESGHVLASRPITWASCSTAGLTTWGPPIDVHHSRVPAHERAEHQARPRRRPRRQVGRDQRQPS